MSITAIVENDTIKLPVHVPVGTKVKIKLIEKENAASQSPHAWMLKYVGIVDDMPADFAAEHNHYIHGTPKRGSEA